MEGLLEPLGIKVHSRLCSELQSMVVRVSEIIPELEAARPRASGIEALCFLNHGINQAKSLLRRCTESSVLYLVLIGNTFMSRCKKLRNLVEHNLSQIQNSVPVILAAKISQIILALRSAVYCLDPLEEESRKVLRDLLETCETTLSSTEPYVLSAIHIVCSRAQISSPEALLIEKRAIMKLIDKSGESAKRKILSFLVRLLNKYINATATGQWSRTSVGCEDRAHFGEVQAKCRSDKAQRDMLSEPVPPEEFLCPLSARLMHDPVVITSGLTYERMWIQKWFDEGHDTCPKTNLKLEHLSFTPNLIMKDIILKWCAAHHFSTPDAKTQKKLVKSWEASINSIGSLAACVDNLNLH